MVHTKTITHLNVGKYLPLFTSTSVNNCYILSTALVWRRKSKLWKYHLKFVQNLQIFQACQRRKRIRRYVLNVIIRQVTRQKKKKNYRGLNFYGLYITRQERLISILTHIKTKSNSILTYSSNRFFSGDNNSVDRSEMAFEDKSLCNK